MSLKKLLGSAMRRVGYQIVPVAMLSELNLCLHLKKLFRLQKIDTVFDVGANRGQYYKLLRKGAQFEGRILSFEPITSLYKALAEKCRADPDWHVFPYALGARPEQLALNVMKLDDLSSFLTPDTTRTDRFRDSNLPERQEIVDVKCLDNIYVDLAAKYGIERPYLKIDTQGYDLNVLKGGSRCLSSFVALQTEASVLPLYKGMPDYREVIDYANRVGFELSGVFPVETDERMRLIEFDCVMISSTQAASNPAPWH